jgi:hypothetical protein
MPGGTTILKFRPATADFGVNAFDADAGLWSDPAEALLPGEAAFIWNPTVTPFEVNFKGAVRQGVLTTPLPAGYSMVASPVPQAGLLQLQLGMPAGGGDVVYLFRDGQYLTSQFDPRVQSWDVEPNLKPGEGFFLFKVQPATWTRHFQINP